MTEVALALRRASEGQRSPAMEMQGALHWKEKTLADFRAAEEPDQDWDWERDTSTMIPCVYCGMGPQYGGTGLCSEQCVEWFYEAYVEPPC